MSLLDGNMLPRQVRTMQPMDELLQAEQTVFDMLEAAVLQMLSDISMSGNQPLLKSSVEALVQAYTGYPCHIEEYPDQLKIIVVVELRAGSVLNRGPVVRKLNIMLPAHLMAILRLRLKTKGPVCMAWRATIARHIQVRPYQAVKISEFCNIQTAFYAKAGHHIKVNAKGVSE